MTMFEDFIIKGKAAMGMAGEKANQMFKVTKLSIKLAELKGEVKKQIIKLGKITYLCNKKDRDEKEKIEKVVKEIDKLRDKIKKLNYKIEVTKHQIVCKSCGKKNCDDELLFCEKCGKEFECDCEDDCDCDEDDDCGCFSNGEKKCDDDDKDRDDDDYDDDVLRF